MTDDQQKQIEEIFAVILAGPTALTFTEDGRAIVNQIDAEKEELVLPEER